MAGLGGRQGGRVVRDRDPDPALDDRPHPPHQTQQLRAVAVRGQAGISTLSTIVLEQSF